MDEKFLQAMIGEMTQGTAEAMAHLTAALVKQLDPHKLKQDLQSQLDAARAAGRPTLAVRLTTHALAAVDAEILLRQQERTARH